MTLVAKAAQELRSSFSLLALGTVLVAFAMLWLGLPSVFGAYEKPASGDFQYIVDGGNVITDERPDSLYRQDQPSLEAGVALAKEGGYIFPFSYPYTPTFALALAPLAKLDNELASRLWQGLTALSVLVLAGLLAASFRGWSWRLLVVTAVVCWEPLLLNAKIGQTGALVAGLSAVAFVTFLRNRKLGAVLLGLLAFKPTAAIAPFFIIFPERWTVWARFYAVVAIVALVPFIWLGPDALFDWVDTLTNRAVVDLGGGHRYNQGLSAVIDLKNPVGIFFVATMLLLLALLVSSVETRLSIGAAAALTVFLALLLNPHSFLYDWGLAFVGILLIRASGILPEKLADAFAGVMVLTLFIAGQVVWHHFIRGETQLHLLTAWASIIVVGLIALALSPSLKAVIAGLPDTIMPRPALVTDANQAVPVQQPTSRRSSRAARRKNRSGGA